MPVYSEQEPLLFENAQNANKLYLDKDLNKRFIHPLRKLSTEYTVNVTSIEKDNFIRGKHIVVLKLDEDDNTPVILTVFRQDNIEDDDGDEKLYINYKIGEQELDLEDTQVECKQFKNMLNITFKGIKPKNDDVKLEDVFVEYTVNLFDKKELETKYENIYAYKIDHKVKSLYSNNIKLKGKNIKNNIYLVVKAPLNEKKEQLLLVDAEIRKGEENILLQFESKNLKVEEESPTRVWPNEEVEKKDEDNKKKNKSKLYIIMVFFVISVLLTFLILYAYIKFISPKEGNIEEEKDYKDVGGIVINDESDKHDGTTTKENDGKKINEEEE